MSPALQQFLQPTALLDFQHPALEKLVAQRGWRELPPFERIGAIYDFVRNEIAFGFNAGDELPASSVLADGFGQCNTKGALLMALLRSCGIACRFHGFRVDKRVQEGAIDGLIYWLVPRGLVHSWVEVLFEDRWIDLEGFILDAPYLASLQRRFPQAQRFCGYGAATADLSAPGVEWCGKDTFIQKEAIIDDLGVFDSPDALYARHGSNLSGLKRFLYQQVVRHAMNRKVARVRAGAW